MTVSCARPNLWSVLRQTNPPCFFKCDLHSVFQPARTIAMSEFIKVSVREGVGIIEIDRKQKMNALNPTCYKAIGEALYQLDADPEVIIGIVSGGDGDWFSSGNDLSYFAEVKSSGQAIDLVQLAKDTSLMVERYVNAWIDFSKPLVAAVNGSAMGIAVTTLALCDVVFCTDIAEFTCPFSGLGQSPEGVSSLLFPRIMGISKASEVLLFGKTLTAQDALRYHLVSDVLPVEGFQAEIWKRVQGLHKIKKLVRDNAFGTDALKLANKKECELLAERFASEECAMAVMQYFAKAQAKKKKRRRVSKL